MRGSAAFRTGVAPGGALAGPWVRNPLWRNARAVPSLDLDFAGNKSLKDGISNQDLISFTRASSATFVDSSGVLQTAVTNLKTFSDAILVANAYNATNSTLTTVTTATPTASTTASLFTLNSGANTGNNTDGFNFGSGTTLTNSTQHTQSLFVKPAGATVLRLRSNVTGNLFDFTLTGNGTIPALFFGELLAASIVPFLNGWYRVSWTFTTTTSAPGNRGDYWTIKTNVADGTNGLYVVGAQLEQASTVGDYVPTTSTINSAPRFDHNPTTGESLGLLVEEARTNSIRNNTGVGAVAGTPGTLPTNWVMFTTTNGLSRTIVGTGTENNIPYIDLQISGTATANVAITIANEPNNFVAAANGQSWTYSAYVKLVAGSFSGFNSPQLILEEYSASATYLAGQVTGVPAPTTTLTRLSATRTNTNALTAFEYGAVRHYVNNGNTVDMTLRIGLPQLEQGAFATSPILTSSATVTRAADVASITGSNFSSWYNQTEGTVFVDAAEPPAYVAFQAYLTLQGASSTDEIRIWRTNTTLINCNHLLNNVAQGTIGLTSSLGANRFVHSYSVAQGIAGSANGGSIATSALTSTIPVTLLRIGARQNNTFYGNRTYKRITYWPTSLSNTTLQQITQP